jgi:hypothetical protein
VGPIIDVKVFKEDEEATKILNLVCLEVSYVKIWLVVPILSICTGLIFLLFLFWYPTLRKKFFYNESTLNRGTHLFVQGTCKYLTIFANHNFVSIRRKHFYGALLTARGYL